MKPTRSWMILLGLALPALGFGLLASGCRDPTPEERTNRRAVDAPIPEEAPVTITALPVRSMRSVMRQLYQPVTGQGTSQATGWERPRLSFRLATTRPAGVTVTTLATV